MSCPRRTWPFILFCWIGTGSCLPDWSQIWSDWWVLRRRGSCHCLGPAYVVRWMWVRRSRFSLGGCFWVGSQGGPWWLGTGSCHNPIPLKNPLQLKNHQSKTHQKITLKLLQQFWLQPNGPHCGILVPMDQIVPNPIQNHENYFPGLFLREPFFWSVFVQVLLSFLAESLNILADQ